MQFRPILSALLRNKTGPLLLALQAAISLAILANALHIVGVRLADARRPSGITDEATLLGVQATPIRQQGFEERMALRQRQKLALQALPGVLSVAEVNQMPLTRNGTRTGIAADRMQTEPTAMASHYATDGPLAATFGLRLMEGRDFVSDDVVRADPDDPDAPGPRVALITRGLARLLYPGSGSALGKPLLFGLGEDAEELRVVGVVERLQTIGAEHGAVGEYSVIVPQAPAGPVARFALRTAGGQLDRVAGMADAALRKASGEPVLVASTAAAQDRANRYRKDRALATMLLAVCALLLLVTASGIVGMVSLWVAQRRKQIGLRRALGARKRDIAFHFVAENLMVTGAGAAGGMVLAVALNLALARQFELERLPPALLLGGAGLLLLLGVAAVLGPALRAAGVPPAVATRSV